MLSELHRNHAHVVAHIADFWLARAAVVVVAILQLLLVNDFSIGPRWVTPAVELFLLVPLSMATAWVHGKVKTATTEGHFHLIGRARRWVRRSAVSLTALVTVMNLATKSFVPTPAAALSRG